MKDVKGFHVLIHAAILQICLIILFFAWPNGAHPRAPSGVNEPDAAKDALKAEILADEWSVKEAAARLDAAVKLSATGGPEAVASLIELLKRSPLDIVRFVAATKLGEIGDRRAVLPLIAALKDSDSTGAVQAAAATALARMGDLSAVDPLIARLGDENADVRASVANALGVIKDIRAVLPLIAALGDEDPTVRYKTARALAEIGNPLAVAPLIASSLGDRVVEVRWWAVYALGEIRDARAIGPLATAVGVKDARVRGPLIDVLDIGDRKVGGALSGLFRDAYWSVRLGAIHALAKIGYGAVEPLVVIMLSNNDSELQKEAAKSLAALKGVGYVLEVLKESHSLELLRELCRQMAFNEQARHKDSAPCAH